MIYRITGRDRQDTYLWRVKLTPKTRWGGVYLHIFLRGDADRDPHDHPWDFWTFPFSDYVEEVMDPDGSLHMNRVPAWRWTRRGADHTHRVVAPKQGRGVLVTLVAYRPIRRDWGFWVIDPPMHGYHTSKTLRRIGERRALPRGDRQWVHFKDYLARSITG